ncbi:MAG: IS1 family transposase [Bacteroidota bacterium]
MKTPKAAMLELDEVFTFVGYKKNQVRIWVAQDRETRQVVSYYIGDGSMASCKALWRKLPWRYQKSQSYSDLWRSYNCLLDHEMVGKGAGHMCHVERFNGVLRHRFSRMVRRSLSFSKKLSMLHLHLKWWMYGYNLDIASRQI